MYNSKCQTNNFKQFYMNKKIEELSTNELQKVNGGWFWVVVGYFASNMAWDLISNPSYCSSEFNRGWNGY